MTPTAAPEGACPLRTAPPWPRASPRRLRPDRSSGSKSNERSGSTGASIQVRNRDLGAVGTGRAVTLRLAGEVNDQHQERDHASDEADGPDKFLQERLISVNGIVAVERLRVPRRPLVAQSNRGMTYQARKARMARTMMTIALYLIAAYPARLDDSGSGLCVCSSLMVPP